MNVENEQKKMTIHEIEDAIIELIRSGKFQPGGAASGSGTV